MPPRPSARRLLCSFAIVLALLLLAGCGGSESITQIQGSSARITKPMLDHWMRAVVATDFRVSIGTKAPRGLASEPAEDRECAQAAAKIVPHSFTGKPKLSDAQISRKCHELHEAIKAQAMSYLLSAQWTMLEAKELGVALSDAELHKEFLRARNQFHETEAGYQAYLKERRLVLSDFLYQLRRNVLVNRITPKFQAKVKQAGGGEKVYTSLALARFRGLIAKTSCKAGYVIEDCRGYRAPAKAPRSPDEILEAFVGGIRS
jgi:hypothetical protein